MIREATPADKPHFLRLWKDLLQSLWDSGYGVIPSDESVGWYLSLFKGYVDGHLFGGCGLWYPEGPNLLDDCGVWYPDTPANPEGIYMFGETHDGGVSTPTMKYGKVGMGWGVYVTPEHRKLGAARSLMDHGLEKAGQLGFDALASDAVYSNEVARGAFESYGWTPHTVEYICSTRRS